MAYIFIGMVTFIFAKKLFSSSSPEVSISEAFSGNFPKINLIDNSFYPIIGIKSEKELIPSDELTSFVTIIGQVIQVNFTSIQKKDFSTKILKTFTFKPCYEVPENDARTELISSSVHFKDFSNLHGLCPDLNEENLNSLYVKNNEVSPPNTYVRIRVLPCTLTNKTFCSDEIGVNLTDLKIILPKGSFTPENADRPITVVGSMDESLRLQSQTQYIKDITLKTVKVYDDKYDFLSESLNTEFAEVDQVNTGTINRLKGNVTCELQVSSMEDENYCEPYVVINIRSGGKVVTIKREYPKLFNVLGELGGFSDLMIVSFSFLYILSRCYNEEEEVKAVILGKDYEKNRKIFQGKQSEITHDKTVKKDMDEIEDEVIQEANDGIKLQQRALEISLLKDMFFKDFHNALMPMIYLKQASDRLSNEDSYHSSQVNRKKLTKISSFNGQSLSLSQALKELHNYQPQNEIDQRIKNYFLANIPPSISHSKGILSAESMAKKRVLIKQAKTTNNKNDSGEENLKSSKVPTESRIFLNGAGDQNDSEYF